MAADVPGAPNADRILEGFMALLSPPGVTSELLTTTLDRYPELLTEPAEVIGRALAGIQPSEKGRANVSEVVSLVDRCRQIGVAAALAEHAATVAAGRTRQRLEAQAARERLKRRVRSARPGGGDPLPWAPDPPFPSLAECRAWLEGTYPQETLTVEVKSAHRPDDIERFEAPAPRFLYRGESGVFPSTLSSMDRLVRDASMPPDALEDILRTAIALRDDLERFGLSRLLAEGFLQHYGVPTHDFDMSAKLDVAVSFAADLAVGEIGALCVMPYDVVTGCMRLIDLRGQAAAPRPDRQAGLVITDPDRIHRDLKALKTVAACDIRWVRFVMTAEDAEAFAPDPWLLDAHSDRAAGLIQILISGYDQMDDDAARWISGRLQPAPFVLLTERLADESTGAQARWVSAEEAGIPYEETDSREGNYRHWSRRHPRPTPQELPPELLADPGEVLTQPGQVLHVLSRRGLESFDFLGPR